MLKRINKYIMSMLVVAMMLSCIVLPTYADNGLSISASASQVSAGGTFTVTIKAGSNYFVEGLKLSVTGGTIVSNIDTKTLDKNEKTTAKIKLTGDQCSVKVTGTSVNYNDDDKELSASASVTVKKKVTTTTKPNTNNTTTKPTTKPAVKKSNDALLSSLSVSEGTLSPAFNKNTLEYNVNLPADASKITLNAKANHAKASVTGTGEKQLKVGTNKFDIVCKAEDGTVKTYKINVNVDETPQVYTTYKDQQLGVVRTITAQSAPATFEETKVTLEGKEVIAFHSNQYNKTIVYLIDEQGNKNYYIYEDGKITSIFKLTSLLGRNVVIFDLTDEEKVRENMVYQEVTIDGVKLNGWKYETAGYENYTHILVMNEMGEKVVYQHESSENSLQLYKEYVEEEVVVEDERSFDDLYFYIACGGAGFFALTTLFMIFKHRRFKKKGIQEIKRYYESRNQD